MKTKLVALMVALLLISGVRMPTLSAAGAQLNIWQQQIVNQMESSPLLKRYLNAGYVVQEGTANLGYLGHNRYQDRYIDFKRGFSHFIIGKCDSDCSDLDMALYNPSGTLIRQDIGPDDYPALEFPANVTGRYTLRVTMANCTAPFGCHWGAIVASRYSS